ncbi:MAG: hypothetical protein B7Z60_05885 [Ferrovum sp. 37-45-19]|jgi:heme/copper-type cytochrome/quinol oxidase subunit 2|uniref:cupredoxin domain-containing protein n=1 Tax=Ferrovum sp. JA12 TaxID=1356299 RepID=UPI0007024486|nr:cupredoxin domain-containing protein [Ferrovum sp. JA12]OYV79514.1 MAG: hypothetical protein B7Z65_06040 [Ferrovum sp. 21-44-67]OYV94257.1 MAG: hypothetical protein B7Z60_05885 [Ferrovum sp. 37-45-19]OZB31712.1 MAG: hypothetical protein B7X47_08635 [Ferrovum sp. 34-44-207]HQT81730.1 cupredoxin domain-containing protein [Ferrovaceae bacterium]KRH78320.1 hypothetical protein FERRO_13030 [Ferrovum sp. JA12]
MKKNTLFLALLLGLQISLAHAQDTYKITITDKGIEPQTLTVPVGKKVALEVINQTDQPVELEGKAFASEIVAPPNGHAKEFIGPYVAGDYGFYNDYNRQMMGTIHSH